MKYLLYLLLFCAVPAFAALPYSAKNMVISGDGFIFKIQPPAGWECNTQVAAEYKANAVLYVNEDSLKNGGALVQLAVFIKQDEFTEKDLEENINSYKAEYNNIQEAILDIQHPTYRTYSKLEYMPGDFYQYIVFLNPGQQYKYGLSVAMNVYKRPATAGELGALREIVTTLLMIRG